MKKLLAMLIILVMIIAPLPRSSAQTNPPKDEVVYAKFDHTGAIDFLSVVNVFRLEQPNEIIDYGDYSDTLNLTTLEPIEQDGDKISVKAEPGVFYYQGNNPNKQLPWNIDLEYLLDGKVTEAKDLAGKTGKLEIKLNLTQNHEADSAFFEHYVLQVSLQFPQEKFDLIQADDATEAVSGEDKLLTFTVLPGKEASFHVIGNVRDFSMKPMMINGLPFAMAFDLPNMDDSLSDLTKLQDGIKQLNDGAQALANGLDQAASGGYSLLGGADQLAGSGTQVSSGLQAFHGGLVQYQTGLNSYKDGVVQFDAGLGELVGGIHQLANGLGDYATGSDTATDGLNTYIDGVNSYIGGIQQMLTMVQPMIDQLDGIKDVVGDFNIRQAVEDTIKASEQINAALKQLADLMGQENITGLDEIKAASSQFLAILAGLDQTGTDVTPLITAIQASIDNLDANLAVLTGISAALRNPDLGAIGADPADPNTQAMLDYMSSQADQIDAAVAQISLGARQNLPTLITSLQTLQTQLNDALAQLGSLAAQYQPIDALIQGLNTDNLDAMKEQLLDFAAEYSTLHQELVTFLTDLTKDLPDTVETVSDGIDQLTAGMKQLGDGSTQLKDGGEQVRDGFKQLNEGAHGLADGAKELASGADLVRNGSSGLTYGITTLASNFDQMVNGSGQISWGLSQLADGMTAYRNGVSAYVTGIDLAGDGSRQLAGGTDELYQRTSGMDQMFKDKFAEMTEEFIPKPFDPVSFVSTKNKHIQVVQFVMMGQAINLPADEPTEVEEPAKKNIWDRIKDLF